MDKIYYYLDGDKRLGPYSLGQLVGKIDGSTLVWYDGLDDWELAYDIDELRSFLELAPPLNENRPEFGTESIGENVASLSGKEYIGENGFFENPFSFYGRVQRLEYNISVILFFIILYFIKYNTDNHDSSILPMFYFPLFWFIWSQSAKRCHDFGKSGWYQVIPFYWVYLMFKKSELSNNRYYKLEISQDEKVNL